MRISLYGLALLVSAALIAGCGDGDDSDTTSTDTGAPATIAEIEVSTGPFESEQEFTDAVNAFCEEAQVIYERTPVYGVSAPGLEAEFETLLSLEREDLAKTESIDAPEELDDEWAAYNEASAALNETHEKVLAAAADGDAEKANAILGGEASKAVEDLTAASEAAGLECVEAEPALSDAEPAQAADAAAEAPQPANTVDDAAEEFLAAFQSGDCEEIVAAAHTQTRIDTDAIADPKTGDCEPRADALAEAEIAGAVQWGPVGISAVEIGPGQFEYETSVIDPEKGGELKHTGGVNADANGLDAPNEGIDADETAQAFVDAIRADDDAAFNETLTIEALPEDEGGFRQDGPIESLGDDPEYAKAIIDDIRADEGATPELLGANQVQAAYLIDTAEGNDYILILTHQPGSETAYRVSAYWALPTD